MPGRSSRFGARPGCDARNQRAYLPGRISRHHGVSGDIGHHHRPHRYDTAVANGHARKNNRAGADPHVVADGDRTDLGVGGGKSRQAGHWVGRMPRSVESRARRAEAAMPADSNLFAHREGAVMSDASVIANDHTRLFAIARSKKEGTLALNGDVIADRKVALALHPVDINSGMQMAAMLGAV